MTPPQPNTVSIQCILSRFIASLMVGVLLFAQTAAAAYACDGGAGAAMTAPVKADAMMAGIDSGGTGHGAMDPAQPALCATHCQSGQQNASAKVAPDLPAAVPLSLYPLTPAVLPARIGRPVAVSATPPPLADPPHAILHCCLRI